MSGSFFPRSFQKEEYSYKTLRTVYHPEGFYGILCYAYMISRRRFAVETVCREVPGLRFGDPTGSEGEISEELKEVILYLGSGKVTGSYSRELDEAVNAVKTNEDRRLEYMTMMIHDMEVREQGRAEGALGMLVNLVKKGRMTPAEAAEEANMTVAEFEKQAALLYA